MTEPVLFALAAFALLIVPGPTNAALATAAAARGDRPWVLLLAVLIGYAGSILLASLLLVPLAGAVPLARPIIKAVLIVYLGYIAFRLWRGAASQGGKLSTVSPASLILITLLNPKGLVLVVSILPIGDPRLWAYCVALAALILIAAGLWYALGRWLAGLTARNASIVPRIGSVILAGLAAWLAVGIAG